ncbi:unnamed protein product [Urochloa humidicola]
MVPTGTRRCVVNYRRRKSPASSQGGDSGGTTRHTRLRHSHPGSSPPSPDARATAMRVAMGKFPTKTSQHQSTILPLSRVLLSTPAAGGPRPFVLRSGVLLHRSDALLIIGAGSHADLLGDPSFQWCSPRPLRCPRWSAPWSLWARVAGPLPHLFLLVVLQEVAVVAAGRRLRVPLPGLDPGVGGGRDRLCPHSTSGETQWWPRPDGAPTGAVHLPGICSRRAKDAGAAKTRSDFSSDVRW